MISIDVVSESNLWIKKIKKPHIFFNSLVKVFPKKYRFVKKKISLTVLLSNNRNIQKLNKKFRNKDKSTDVLSFPTEKKINIKKSPYIGDIIVSYEFMNKPKNLSVLDFKSKVSKVFIHSFLHLLGYNHINLKDFKEMLGQEEKIYKAIEKKIVKLI